MAGTRRMSGNSRKAAIVAHCAMQGPSPGCSHVDQAGGRAAGTPPCHMLMAGPPTVCQQAEQQHCGHTERLEAHQLQDVCKQRGRGRQAGWCWQEGIRMACRVGLETASHKINWAHWQRPTVGCAHAQGLAAQRRQGATQRTHRQL